MKVFITGITGMTGSYLAELYLAKGDSVHGLIRRSSSINTKRIDHIFDKLHLHFGDMTDATSLSNIINQVKPDLVLNMAAMSHVKVSFEMPLYTEDVVALGATRLLEIIRYLDYPCRYYQASSSELYGNSPAPQNEQTPMNPQSPYSIAKYHAYLQTINYRNGYGVFASNGILFNHTGERRGETFVTRKISRAVAAIVEGTQKELLLGNLQSKRDFGYAKEYAGAIVKIMELDNPIDLCIGTGETHSIEEFVTEAFSYVNLDWRDYVRIDERYYRPTEVNVLQADCRIAEAIIDWKPKVRFKELVHLMVDADLEALRVKDAQKVW